IQNSPDFFIGIRPYLPHLTHHRLAVAVTSLLEKRLLLFSLCKGVCVNGILLLLRELKWFLQIRYRSFCPLFRVDPALPALLRGLAITEQEYACQRNNR